MERVLVRSAAAMLCVTVLLACAIRADEKEKKIPLEQLPAAIKAAAEGAMKGLVLTSAETETKGSTLVYEVKGTAGGKKYEVKLSSDAKVLKVEADDEDDDGDDDDDDDDDDDGKAGAKVKKVSEKK